MLFEIDHEIWESHKDHNTIRSDTSIFLRPTSVSQPTRYRRAAGIGLASLPAVSLFGGVASGGTDSCGFRGYFGGCHDEAQANAANIRRLSDYEDLLTKFETEFSTNTDDNFFLVKNELAALNAFQAKMVSF